MGISGLLPLLKSIHKHTTLKKFAGQTIGIDGYGWLHRGAVACALDLALDKPTTKYVDFAVSRVRMLLDFGIVPYVVFDGDNLPSKAGTNEERRKRRSDARALGLSLYKAGKVSQAQQELQKATGVTPYMARLLIEELKRLDVQYIVAPYEADAQLAYLEQKGIINGILSEDSDLLVFGAKRLITKLNQYGECVEIDRNDFPLCKEVSLAGWTDAMFRRMAILSGCDYLPNIDKMGLKTAYRFVRRYKEAEKTIRMIAFEGKFCVPADYIDKFNQAELTFMHHRVFCPIRQQMVFLTDPARGMTDDDMPYLGPYMEPDVVVGVACGDLNPKTKLPIEIKASTSTRPLLRENRRQTLGTPSDLKKRSSIDSFFKPQRTPLQELDPNSLTPSPSQQRLLERHQNTSWEPRPVSSAPQLRRTVTATPSSGNNLDRSSFLARASTISNYKPPKRQRLCSENEEATPSKEIKESPFFTSNISMSPLGQKKSRARKSKREFDVWSDDSVDGILLGLVGEVDAEAATQSSKQEDVLGGEKVRESPAKEADLETIPQSSPPRSLEESQGPQFSNAGTQSQPFITDPSQQSQSTIIGSINHDDHEDPDGFDDLLEYHVRKQNEKLAATYVAQSLSRQASALRSLSPKKRAASASSTTDTEEITEQVSSSRSVMQTTVTSTKSDTILASPPAPSKLLKTFYYQSSDVQVSALQSLNKTQSNQHKVQIGREALDQHRNQGSSCQRTETPSLIRGTSLSAKPSAENLRGSEDALIPNSDEEASETEDKSPKATISLKSFVFKG